MRYIYRLGDKKIKVKDGWTNHNLPAIEFRNSEGEISILEFTTKQSMLRMVERVKTLCDNTDWGDFE